MEIHASLRAEDLFYIGPLPITNSMIMAWLAVIVLSVFAFFAGRNPQIVPRGAQNVFEFFLEALMGLAEKTAGHYARRLFPLVATLFLFILTANYMALLPGVGTIYVGNPHAAGGAAETGHAFVKVAEASGLEASAPAATSLAADPPTQTGGAASDVAHEPPTVPLLRAANADVNMTLGMGLIAFIFIHASGVMVHGLVGYIRDDLAKPLLLTPVKLVIELFLPVSLSMRLFGNVFGGEMLLTVMNFPVVALPFLVMELLFGFIQALIFTMLTLIFCSLATYVPASHGQAAHEDDEAHGERPAGPAGAHGEPSMVPAHA
ncbi:MAG: F0F1 ATP synthase subunit A [Chloroflexota bacterium]|nr:F0F1 ATP synthase subunit A [Chloroflexota bacterium]